MEKMVCGDENAMKEAYLAVQTRKQISKVKLKEILYIENDRRRIVIHTITTNYTFYGRMEDVYEKLGEGFYKCHSRCILNFNMVESMKDGLFYLSGGETLHIGQNYYQSAKKKYKDFLLAHL